MSEERERGAAKPQGCELPPPEGTGRPVAVADDARPHVRLERCTPPPTISPGRTRSRQLAIHQGFSPLGCLLVVSVMATTRQVLPVTHAKLIQKFVQAVILTSLPLLSGASNLRTMASNNPAHHPTGEHA